MSGKKTPELFDSYDPKWTREEGLHHILRNQEYYEKMMAEIDENEDVKKLDSLLKPLLPGLTLEHIKEMTKDLTAHSEKLERENLRKKEDKDGSTSSIANS